MSVKSQRIWKQKMTVSATEVMLRINIYSYLLWLWQFFFVFASSSVPQIVSDYIFCAFVSQENSYISSIFWHILITGCTERHSYTWSVIRPAHGKGIKFVEGHSKEIRTACCQSCWDQYSWWRHQMETFSALLAICAGNSPVPGEFPTQRPVTRSFDVHFDLRLNKRLCKQS